MFISLSAAEGLPVSVMEAISFGIPVVAAAVSGVPEIVTPDTGVLVEVHDRPDAAAAAARRIVDGVGPARDQIVSFCRANFDAENNYGHFADMLSRV
jgi:glycosyltransferase involved in cell wall biosynthesis